MLNAEPVTAPTCPGITVKWSVTLVCSRSLKNLLAPCGDHSRYRRLRPAYRSACLQNHIRRHVIERHVAEYIGNE